MKDSLSLTADMRLWDMGQIADRMSLSAAETEKLDNITTHPPSRHKLRSLRQ